MKMVRGVYSTPYWALKSQESGTVCYCHHNNIEFELATYTGYFSSAYVRLTFYRNVWELFG